MGSLLADDGCADAAQARNGMYESAFRNYEEYPEICKSGGLGVSLERLQGFTLESCGTRHVGTSGRMCPGLLCWSGLPAAEVVRQCQGDFR